MESQGEGTSLTHHGVPLPMGKSLACLPKVRHLTHSAGTKSPKSWPTLGPQPPTVFLTREEGFVRPRLLGH